MKTIAIFIEKCQMYLQIRKLIVSLISQKILTLLLSSIDFIKIQIVFKHLIRSIPHNIVTFWMPYAFYKYSSTAKEEKISEEI